MNEKIDIEIHKIDNGWVIEDSYFGDEKYFEDFPSASNEANRRLLEFQKIEEE